jgi:hypothetical protein
MEGTRPQSTPQKQSRTNARQHAAIEKLVEMCAASAVVSDPNKGITAEVRRDRDGGKS